MSEKEKTLEQIGHHHHPDGTRCCGRHLSQKCSAEEEASKINPETGHKSCCGKHHKEEK